MISIFILFTPYTWQHYLVKECDKSTSKKVCMKSESESLKWMSSKCYERPWSQNNKNEFFSG